MAARKRSKDAGGELFAAEDGEFAALLAVPGQARASGPGTTIGREWAEGDRRLVTLTYRGYAGGSESFPARLHGVHLDADGGRPLGLLLAKVNSDAPWKEKLAKSEIDLPRIHLFARIEAFASDLWSTGDADALATRVLAEYGRFLAESQDRNATDGRIGELWAAYAEWVGGGKPRRDAARELARRWIGEGGTGTARERAVGRVAGLG
jgi:hypothetical protein